jgi:hypothetical protein
MSQCRRQPSGLIILFFTEQKRKEAVAAANSLTQALVDHLNVG